jgi:hypothetical protein
MERTFSGPSELELKAVNGNADVSFRLTFQSSSPPQTVQFVMPSGHAMAILSGLQRLQRLHGWPIPHRMPRGKPNLRIVSSDDKT